MSKQTELNLYIAQLQGRLRVATSLRGAAIFATTALAITVALVMTLNRYAFPAPGVSAARAALVAALALAAALGLVWPLLRLTRARAVSAAERAHPELEQRLTTFQQRRQADPFRELLAADTLARTMTALPSTLAPNGLLLALGGAGLASLAILLWIVTAGPGYLGYGASLLWTGPKKNVTPLYALAVMPGDVAVRRNSDQLITAELTNLQPEKVQLFAHFANAKGWEPVVMQPQPAGGAPVYQFLFTGLPETVEYYVAAGPLVSPHYKVRVVDLPSVKTLRVTYHYPRWTGMKAVTEEHSGDLRALEGTDAAIEIEMDRPLTNGQLTLDGGKTIQLTPGEGNRYTGSIHMEKDGAYHVAALDAGQPVRLSEDYFIATEKATPPEVAMQRPGGDYRASPIEEVTVGVKAADAFGLRDVHLHYSVNGGPDRDVSLLKPAGAQAGVKTVDGAFTLHLEDFKLVPGDLISLYATARDGHAETRTPISFIQADPFEREFSQSQQGGGGGGGGGQGNQTEISKREKELIAATWKQQNDKAATPKDAATAGQFLADAQQKLRDQVMALSARIESRDLSQANEEFTSFEKDMQAAAAAMVPSTAKLQGMQWSDALPLEQKALQSLLRAEATFRQIQVAFSQQSGGGGGGGGAGRDLASLFDLELDTEKNQYETAQTASPAEQHAKEVEDALAKLDALAKQQEELAGQQHNPQQSLQERWQQEMLRREAEQLQRQMEQLAQDKQNQQNGQQRSSASSASQSGSPSSSSASGQNSRQFGSQESGSQSHGLSESNAQNQRIEQAASRLRQATEAMKRSTDAQSTEAARQAADRLRDARELFGTAQRQMASGKMDDLSHEADRMVQEERAQADRIDKLAGNQAGGNVGNPLDQSGATARREERNRLAAERQQLSNDLSALQKKVRDAARAMAPNQPDAAKTLRDALTEMDQADLDNHMQRTADWLRRGINPKSNGTEDGIAQGLEKLDRQLHQAQQAMGRGAADKPGQRGFALGDQTVALGQVERLRSQLEAMVASRTRTARQPQNGKDGQQGDEQPRNGSSSSRNGSKGRSGGQAQANGTSGKSGSGNPQTAQNARESGRQGGGQPGGQSGDYAADRGNSPGNLSGDLRTGGGGGNDGTVWGNLNTGNNRYGPAAVQPIAPRDASGNPADTERAYRRGITQLNQLRQTLQGDPQEAKEVQELTRQMQRLDPSRFPGNPAMVEQMHQEMLSAVDRLELQLQRDSTTEARTGKPAVVPSGYQDSVADYYRRLSKAP